LIIPCTGCVCADDDEATVDKGDETAFIFILEFLRFVDEAVNDFEWWKF
jgi:hypothetical protein